MWPKTARERDPPFARLDRKAIGVKEERHAARSERLMSEGVVAAPWAFALAALFSVFLGLA
jgi:hypothetical protein